MYNHNLIPLKMIPLLLLICGLLISCSTIQTPEVQNPINSPFPTYTQMPQAKILRTSTSTVMPTPANISTPSIPLASNTAEPQQIKGQVAIVIQLSEDISVFDENFQLLNNFQNPGTNLSTFSNNGCFLLGTSYPRPGGRFIIDRLDLQGKSTKKISVDLIEAEDRTKIYQYTLSPSGNWLAYKVVDQIAMSANDAAVQNVRLIKVDDQVAQETLKLTERGGARWADLVWPLDSRYLAYTDFDDTGISQIYIYNPEENLKFQITHFGQEMRNHEIREVQWSPNASAIAFLVVGVERSENNVKLTDNGKIGIVSIPEFKIDWLNLKGYENYSIYNLGWGRWQRIFWSTDNQNLVIPLQSNENKEKIMHLVWYDLKTNSVIYHLSASEIAPLANFAFAFPLNSAEKIGIWGTSIYLYSPADNKLDRIEKKYYLKDNSILLVAPNGPVDMTNCSK